jgi:hypothetical protein
LNVGLIAEGNAGDPVNQLCPAELRQRYVSWTSIFLQLNFQGLKFISITQRIYSLQEERYHQFRWERCSKKFHSLSLLWVENTSYMNDLRRWSPVTNVSRSAFSILSINMASCASSSCNPVWSSEIAYMQSFVQWSRGLRLSCSIQASWQGMIEISWLSLTIL